MPIAAIGSFHEEIGAPPDLTPEELTLPPLSSLPNFAWLSASPFTIRSPGSGVVAQLEGIWGQYQMPLVLAGGALLVILLMPKGRRRRRR